ncbi:hypothetical protein C1H76_9491 [Elsinoe australis]|uniref:Uncharacterized protein n=1 Tax=Elsinoe australis TaxID=40998 RepID=A0A4U7AQH3_9PEZI|nr:hypothetical protein C1H76_9491 [Elsinoe australis]
MTSPAAPRRSGSRSRRSHASFSDLRLAPLSTPPQHQSLDNPSKPTNLKLSLDSPRTPGSVDPSTAHAYKVHHPSYLAGRSAPSTPGILSRSSSRKARAGGLSRALVHDDDEDDDNENKDPNASYFSYSAIRVNASGAVDRSEGYVGDKGKSKSESGLHNPSSKRQPRLRPLSTAGLLNSRTSTATSAITPRGRTSARKTHSSTTANDDDWLTHATSFTTSLLQEGKSGAWVSTHNSVTNLHSYSHPSTKPFSSYANSTSSSSDEEDDRPQRNLSDSQATVHPRLSAAALAAANQNHTTASPLRSPALGGHGWSSRFGSRLPSAATSRRGSRANLTQGLTPFSAHPGPSALDRPTTAGSIDAVLSTHQDMRPDFVSEDARREMDASLAEVERERRFHGQGQWQGQGQGQGYFDQAPHLHDGEGGEEPADDDDDEEEVARLARTPGFGLGGFGIIDRLVGLGGFGLEGGAESEGEDQGERDRDGRQEGKEGEGNRKRRSVMLDLQGVFGRQKEKGQGQEEERMEGKGKEKEKEKEEGGWSDAAWLLSVASKALLS